MSEGIANLEALAPLKQLAASRQLPLAHAVRFDGPRGKSQGVLQAAAGRLSLASNSGVEFDVALESIENANFPRLRGGIELRVAGQDYKIDLGGFIPGGLKLGASDSHLELSDEARSYAHAAGATGAAETLDIGLFLVEGVLRLFGTGARGDVQAVIEGRVTAEEVAEKRIDEIIEEEEIFASEGL